MQHIVTGRLRLAYDFRIINEYREVLLRPKFQFRRENIYSILQVIEIEGTLIQPKPIELATEDPGDRPFIEIAIACSGAPLVTGNLKHFIGCECFGLEVISPTELVNRFKLF